MKWLLAASAVVIATLITVVLAIEHANVTPRRLAVYIAHRVSGHRPAIEQAGDVAARLLLLLDRGQREWIYPVLLTPSRSSDPVPRTPNRARVALVGSTSEALNAIARSVPGDAITFLPGTYRFKGSYIEASRAGTVDSPITVRAAVPGSVTLEFDMVEGFLVSAPYWQFEDLRIRGICADDSNCEHAFHVVGNGTHFAARRNVVTDFNAHFKINGIRGAYPDNGVIEGNFLSNSRVRATGNPVTPIDLVAASHWVVQGNRISDFAKGESDRISYGAFFKGGGEDNRFERNVVICEERLRGAPGQRVGLSLGGGGTAPSACRDGTRCITEQNGSVIASNLIASCSDDGIYLNRAAMSMITHNTLIDTGGITARFAETSADIEGNLIDGVIRASSAAVVHMKDNFASRLTAIYLGLHRVRDLFVDAGMLDLRWRKGPVKRPTGTSAPADLCTLKRSVPPAYGAFDNIVSCITAAPER